MNHRQGQMFDAVHVGRLGADRMVAGSHPADTAHGAAFVADLRRRARSGSRRRVLGVHPVPALAPGELPVLAVTLSL